MEKVEHIGLAVKNMNDASQVYAKLLGTDPYKTERVAAEQVNTAFFRIGETKIELLEATAETSAIAKFIQKRGEVLHHIAFAVADIVTEMARLKQAGFTLLNETPKPGADHKLVCFVHPKEAHGVLIELCQERS